MAGTWGSNDLVAQIAGQSQGLINNTQAAYGQMPNPQLLHDATAAGAIPDLLHATTQADPVYGSIIPAHPISSGTGVDLLQSAPITSTPYSFDWKAYQAAVKKSPQDNQGYGSIGGRPVANMGYVQGVESWVAKDPKSARSWQSFLRGQGFYDPKNKGTADGRWADADQTALEQYMVHLALPEALYAKGDQSQLRRASASQLVNDLTRRWGRTIDLQQLGKDVASNEKVRGDVATSWLLTQADPLHNQGQRLARFTDLYGDQAISAAEKKFRDSIRDPGLLEKLVNLPLDIVEAPVKGIDGLLTMLSNGVNEHLPFGLAESQQTIAARKAAGEGDPLAPERLQGAQAQKAFTTLTAADQQLLSPAIQDVAQSRGWLAQGFQWFSQESNRLKLFAAYSMGDAIRDPLGVQNPMTELRRAWDGAGAHQNEVMAGLFGKPWVQQHSSWAQLGEVANSFVDPSLLLGPLGRVATAGHLEADLARATEVGSALSRDDSIASTVSLGATDKLSLALRPKAAMAAIQQRTLPTILLNPKLSIVDKLRVTGAINDPARADALTKFLVDEQGKPRQGLTPQDAVAHLQEMHAHILTGSQSHFNYATHLKMLTPVVQKRLSGGKLSQMYLHGTFDFGHRHIDLLNDLPTALQKMEQDAHVEGIPAAQMTDFMNRMWLAKGDPGKLVDVFHEFYDELAKHTEPAFHQWLDQQRGAANNYAHGVVPSNLQRHVYAPDPHPKPGAAAKERSTGPRRLENQVIEQVKTARIARSQTTQVYQATVGDWWEKVHGLRPQTQQDWERALAEFEAHPGNADIVQEHATIIKAMEDKEHELAPLGIERGVPMVPAQLSHLVVAPYSTFERVLWKHPTLKAANRLTDKMKLDELMNIWKVWQVAKPSTMLRAAMGDDILRWSSHLMLMGSGDSAVNALLHSRLTQNPATQRMLKVVEPALRSHLGRVVTVPVSAAMNLTTSLGAGTIEALRGATGHGVRDVTAERLGPILGREIHGYLSQFRGAGDFHPIAAHEDGHRQAFEHALAKTFNHPYVQEWARLFDAEGPAAAESWLAKALTSDSPEMKQLLSAKGINSVQSQIAQNVTHHEAEAARLGRALDDLDAKAGTYQRGPRAGQPRYDPADYRSLYRAMPKRGLVGETEIPGLRGGSYRDKVVNRINYHVQQMAPAAAVRETAKNTHDYFAEFLDHPDMRKWVADGQIQKDVLDQWYKDPELRAKLPTVVASSDSMATRGLFQKAATALPHAFMEHVFSNFIKGARGRGAEQIRTWWRNQLDEFYPEGTSDFWTPEQKDRSAIAEAQSWIHQNTYQGSQRIADHALRQAFPFVGAANSMRRFIMSEVKAHPWLAGVLTHGAASLDDHKNFSMHMNPLSLLGITGGDELTFNPFNSMVATREGIGSLLPGLGPLLAPLEAMATQDAGVRRFMSGIPGWGDHLPQQGGSAISTVQSTLGAALPSTLQGLATGIQEVAGADQQNLSVTEKRAIADETQAQLARGQTPTPRDAETATGAAHLGSSVLSWFLPISPKFEDQRGAAIRQAQLGLPANPTAADYDKAYAAHPDIAPALQVFDPRTTIQQADQIRQANPWVDAYTTSKYVDPNSPTGKPQNIGDLAQFRDRVNNNEIQIAGVGDMVQRYQVARRNTAASMYYDQYVKQVKTAWQQQNPGLTTTSAEYKASVKPYVDQQMAIIQQNYPEWWDKFYGKGFSVQAQEANSAPISTLSALYDLPPDPGMETPRTAAMRNIMYVRDLVSSRIVELQNEGADQTAVQGATQLFHDYVVGNYGQDPEVAPMLDLYHWSQWSDFLRAGEAHQKQQQTLAALQ